jgi:hypothetical protein
MGALRTVALAGTVGLVMSLAAAAAHAQGSGASVGTLTFEAVGDRPIDASDLAFDADTLWAVGTDLWRLPPDGAAWEEVSDDGEHLFEAPSSSTLLAGTRAGSGVIYSEDRGATWLPGLISAGTWSPWAEAFAELPPEHPQAGRLVAACWAGMSYSDGGGQTWQKSSLWTDGGRYDAHSVAVGVDGRVYAAFYEVGVTGLQVAASDDGGQTYAVAYQFGVLTGIGVRIVALPGGADPSMGVLIVVEYGGKVRRSDDGAASWRVVGEVPFEDGGHLEDAVVGPDGRLYVAGARPGGGEWVFRTVGPVVSASAVEVAADPVSPPVVIGPGGGSFPFTVRLTNTTTLPMTFEAWSAATGPYTVSPVLGPVSGMLPPGASVTRTLVQRVPGAAPPGTYTYTVNTGDFPGAVLSSDSFPVMKEGASGVSAGASGDAGAEGWTVSGWEAAAMGVPEAGVGLSVWPNPARGATTVALVLPEAGEVAVALYDVLGRRVALLHEGVLEAGSHMFRLDGAALPAGVYVVRTVMEPEDSTGARALTQRVTLMR